MALQAHGVAFPWRTANDADFDITGDVLPQGIYRSIVFGDKGIGLFSYDPDTFDKVEMLSRWGFIGVEKSWTWHGREGKPVRVVVFSGAEEVSLRLNGKETGRLRAGEKECPGLPKSFCFETVYEPGTLEAIGYQDGKEVSRTSLITAGEAASLRLVPETDMMYADGESLCYVRAEVLDANGNPVPNAEIPMEAKVEGNAELIGFGSGAPCTAENYTTGRFKSWRGQALAILRAGTEPGNAKLTISAEGFADAELNIPVKR